MTKTKNNIVFVSIAMTSSGGTDLALHEQVNNPGFKINDISIAVDNEPAETLATDSGVEKLKGLRDNRVRFIGFDFNLAAFALAFKYGVLISPAFETANYLKLRGMKATLANAQKYLGEEGLSELDVARNLWRRILDEKRFPELEYFISVRLLKENICGVRLDREVLKRIKSSQVLERALLVEKLAPLGLRASEFGDPEAELHYVNKEFDLDLKSIAHMTTKLAALCKEEPELWNFLRLRKQHESLKNEIQIVDKLLSTPDRVYFPLKYAGSRSGRLTGGGPASGFLNLQGLPAHFQSGRVRRAIIPEEGEFFIIVDLASIEPRVAAFIVGVDALIVRFKNDDDIYIWFAQLAFPGFQVVKNGQNDHLRQLAKLAIIGAIYGQGLDSFINKALEIIPDADIGQLQQAYNAFKETFPQIGQFRARLFQAFKDAFFKKRKTRVGKCYVMPLEDCSTTGASVEIVLPTGRSLYYRSILQKEEYDKRDKDKPFYCADVLDLTAVPKPKRPSQKRSKIDAIKLVNHVIQGTARDVLMSHWKEIERENPELRVRFSIHDELIIAAPKCACEDVGAHRSDCPWVRGKEQVKSIMSRVSPILGAKMQDMPVACEISEKLVNSWGK